MPISLPPAADLLLAAREYLEAEVLPQLRDDKWFNVRVALNVLALQCGEPIGLVLFRVLVIADPHQRSIEYPHRGAACAELVADVIGDVLGWDSATRTREVEQYIARVEAERASQSRLDDDAADAVRTAAPEVRPMLTHAVLT